MTAVRRWAFVVALALMASVLLGCGDDDSKADDGDTACVSIDGNWEITGHCQASQVGSAVTVHQSGCTISSLDQWPGWTGSIASSDAVTMSGPGGTSQMTCTGKVSGSVLTMTCNPACDVQLTRK